MSPKIKSFVIICIVFFTICMVILVPSKVQYAVEVYENDKIEEFKDSIFAINDSLISVNKSLTDKVNKTRKEIASLVDNKLKSSIDDSDSVSYYYVYYDTKNIRGYTTLKIDVPYYSHAEVDRILRKRLEMGSDEYLQQSFIMPISQASYIDYHSK